jgi:hypothetical protein
MYVWIYACTCRYVDRYLEYGELRSDEWIGQLRDLYTLEDNDGQAHEVATHEAIMYYTSLGVSGSNSLILLPSPLRSLQ